MNPSYFPPRVASEEDIPALEILINRAYVAEAPFVYGFRTDRDDLRVKLMTRGTTFLVIDRPSNANDASLAGCVCLDCDGNRGHIGLLSVDPDCQGTGLGAVLVGAAESHCLTTRGCSLVELEVISARTDLFPFYEKLGYVTCGTIPFPIPLRLKQDAHLVVMRKVRRQ
jgi:GNAT superfamily N-acetyltransferase